MTTDAQALHRDAIVIDGVCPLLMDPANVSYYLDGGLTAAIPTIAIRETAEQALRIFGRWHRFIAGHDRLRLARAAADIEAAKRDGDMAIVFHFQGTDAVEDDLDMLDAYKALGLGMVQLAYNVKCRVGDGALERTDAGLSLFGVDLVKRCNELGIVVDGSHTGYRTTMDAIEASTQPVVFSHANARALHPSPRNITDEQMRACAATGGIVGINGFPSFLGEDVRPTLDRFVAFIDYAVDLMGVDHVGLGIDYYMGMDPIIPAEKARARYDDAIRTGRWDAAVYPPPPHYFPEGIETPATLHNLTARLLARGYTAEDVRKVMGGNWLRVFRQVWGG
ncbi:MAG: peptidase M19 [Rhodospirillales bacterium CG15_BIG_FIL_POST_REV_8_21_14_020_66_15]|nr:MAG: peptidase M19 [Rhodospirillales bacterium CG15_BIG_FIL_POST_REV_8_21_14_020_66_15]